VGSAGDWDAALEAARQSITLLKNDKNTLPLMYGPYIVYCIVLYVTVIKQERGATVLLSPQWSHMLYCVYVNSGAKNILVVGPTANSLTYQTGTHTYHLKINR
jgi:beta-glucosidase-like glycosyl hydrolase